MSRGRPATVPPCDPGAGYRAHQAEIDAAVRAVLLSGSYILGPEVASFERSFAASIGVRHGIGVGSGTDALALALRACGVGPGDLVFTVSHTAAATVVAIESTGATPVLVEVDPLTFTLDPECLQAALAHPPAGRPKAVVPVHLYGHPADMPAILALARRHGLAVVEDCAQAHGAALDGRPAGGWGDLAAFSFYPTKNLGALGDGGLVATDDPGLAERVRLLREYGWRQRYVSDVPGVNSRLDELQAAILTVKLPHLEAENERRRALALIYDELLADAGITLPVTRPGVRHAMHQYAIRLSRRDALQEGLRLAGIGTLVHYPVPLHLQPAYRGRLPCAAPLSRTEQIAREVLSLPLYPQLGAEQARLVGREVVRLLR